MSKEALKLLGPEKGVDNVSKTIDTIHDKVVTVNTNITTVVTTAKKAMAGISMNDVMSMTPRECLIPLKRVMDALNAVKGVHPFVGLAVTAFEVLLTLEMKRRENDKRVSGILLKQADMMMALLQLDNIKDVDMKNEKGETVAGRLQTLIAEIRMDIMTCGNVIDTYYKQKFLAKFLKAGSWEDKFVGFASTFDKRKDEIKFALEIHVTIKLDTVADQVTNIDVKMDMLIHLFKDQTPQEKELAAEVERLGGIETCMRSEGLLAQLDHEKTIGGKTSTSLIASVRTPVETLIEENKAYFDVKMEAQTRQIDNAIQRSARKIIKAFGDGPWKRIQDPDIRQVWKDMNAHASVKARYLVLALHDHYLDQYENVSGHGETSLEVIPPSPTFSHAESEATDAVVDTAFLHNPPLEADKWCLQYLSIQNVPPIAEALDDDVSGFIKIAEVNNFSNDKPEGISMIRWVTFWAAGSAVEASIYHLRIEKLVEELLDIAVMPENRGSYAEYKNWLIWIPWLLRSRSHETTEDPELIDLIRQHMTLQEKAITDALEPAKWEFDDSDTVSTLLGSGRIEKYLYPTLYLVLRYHYQVFSLGSEHVLDEREFEVATGTIWSILDVCDDRTTVLTAAFDQRRGIDDFKRFAGGLFNNFNTKNPYRGEDLDTMPPFELDSDDSDDEQYEMEDKTEEIPELEIEKLHFGIVDDGQQLDESEKHRAYIDLYKKKLSLEYGYSTLNAEDTAKMAEFDSIPEPERLICQKIATREFNKGGYHKWVCNGCGMWPILGTHYQCIGCLIDIGKKDFDLCQNCVVQLPEKTSTDCSYHPSSHPMNRFPYVIGSLLRNRNREKALEKVKESEKTANTAFTCSGPCGKEDAHGIHFRCIECEHYVLCADCISSHESDDVADHGPSHVFTRFSGEPLVFKPKKKESEISDQARMANIESVLAKFEERLGRQEHLMQSVVDALNVIRMAVGKGSDVKKE